MNYETAVLIALILITTNSFFIVFRLMDILVELRRHKDKQ